MPVTLQVVYPIGDESQFDFGYYLDTHMPLVAKHMGAHIQSTLVTRGVSGGGDRPAPFHAVATIVFADQAALDAALGASGPVLADIPNFTDSKPKILIGDVVG